MHVHGRPILPDRFRIDREIGRGGMAAVYLAQDLQLARPVAIKVLSEDFSRAFGPERFQREIAVLTRLVHPRIVPLIDSGHSKWQLYYVMPFMAGDTLRVRLAREARLAPAVAASLAADIAEALAFAHRFGVIHRDVKPENVFAVGARGMLADFGIARVARDSEIGGPSYRTTAGVAVGTMAYMSPEQASADAVIDGRSDLYSLGCVLYELLTGKPPFTGKTPLAVMTKHFSEAPQPLTEHRVAAPPALEALLMRLLAKDPDRRPARADDVAALLRSTTETGSATGFYPALRRSPDVDTSAH
jgi:serine/threonine-protein kinase